MFYRIFSASNIIRYCVFAIAFGLVGWGIAVVGVSSEFYFLPGRLVSSSLTNLAR